ncbi:hypothetical protein NCCP2331_18820 [Sporosarcina sp. NCCP-2331]|nr:hypothetical protein NCCP2331_18820 [Sporosarcina sp. NCCP-2331]GLB55853.1 hypothetical protein NCCP2378_16400 [Sporosarcina sp. NCCP-2378]
MALVLAAVSAAAANAGDSLHRKSASIHIQEILPATSAHSAASAFEVPDAKALTAAEARALAALAAATALAEQAAAV